MPIKVECDCGRVMTVKDELAGKLVKCPECRETVRVPAGDDEEEAPRKRSQAIRRRRDDEDDYEDDRPARKKRTASRYDDEDDYDDDYDEDDYDRPRRRRGTRKAVADGLTVTLLSIGIAALLALGLATLPAVYTLSVSASSTNKEVQKQIDESKKLETDFRKLPKDAGSTWPSFIDTWRGIVLLVLAILLMGVAVASLILLFTAGRQLAHIFLVVTAASATGFGVLALLWFLGYVFKGFAMSFSITGPIPQGGTATASIGVWPSWGLWLGLLFAGAVVGVFLPLVMKRGALWGVIGLGVGALLGLVLLAADAQPWNSPLKPLKEALKDKKAPPKMERPWFFPEKGPTPWGRLEKNSSEGTVVLLTSAGGGGSFQSALSARPRKRSDC